MQMRAALWSTRVGATRQYAKRAKYQAQATRYGQGKYHADSARPRDMTDQDSMMAEVHLLVRKCMKCGGRFQEIIEGGSTKALLCRGCGAKGDEA